MHGESSTDLEVIANGMLRDWWLQNRLCPTFLPSTTQFSYFENSVAVWKDMKLPRMIQEFAMILN